MKSGDPLNDLAAAIHQACLRDLPEIHYMGYDSKKAKLQIPYSEKCTQPMTRRPTPYDLDDVEMWSQMWGSTALGFGGMGGAAMTTATVILVWMNNRRNVAVYFGGRHAYTITNPNEKFWEHYTKKQMGDVSGAIKRYETPEKAP